MLSVTWASKNQDPIDIKHETFGFHYISFLIVAALIRQVIVWDEFCLNQIKRLPAEKSSRFNWYAVAGFSYATILPSSGIYPQV